MGLSESARRSPLHSFDIDTYLNPFIPRPRLHYLPRPISYFLGYRPATPNADAPKQSNNQPSNLLVWLFSFLGGFIGIAIVEHVYLALPQLDNHDVPLIIASFGAAAILEYNTIESPLAQPRNVLLGHLISAFIAVAITKLFQLLPPTRFEELRWLAGAISVGAASATMAITKTIHPPAGATALLAATNAQITDLGWWLLALVVLGSSLMLASALIVNNIYSRFPTHWWTPVDLNKLHQSGKSSTPLPSTTANDSIAVDNAEKGLNEAHDTIDADGRSSSSDSDMTVMNSREDADPASLPLPLSSHQSFIRPSSAITINSSQVILPDQIQLSPPEKQILESLRARLAATQ